MSTEAEMQAAITELTIRMGTMESTVKEEKRVSTERHTQNRNDIHDLRSSFQSGFERMADKFAASLDKMTEKLGRDIKDAITPIAMEQAKQDGRIEEQGKEIVNLKMKWAKAGGYALGGAAVGSIVVEAVLKVGEHFWK